MKKSILFLSTLVLLLPSCQKKDSAVTSKTDSDSDSSIIDNESNSEDVTSESIIQTSTLTINYVMEDGLFIDREEKKIEIGSSYSYKVTKEIPFMKADTALINGVKKAENETINVVYSYSEVEYETSALTSYNLFMADIDKGITFSFVMDGKVSSSSVLLQGDNFVLGTDYVSDNDKHTFSFTDAFLEDDISSTSLLMSDDEESLIHITVDKDAITYYKNGHKRATFFNSLLAEDNSYILENITKNIFTGIEGNGLSIGKYDLHNFKVTSYKTDNEVKDIAKEYIITEINSYDESGKIAEWSKVSKESYSYSYTPIKVAGYNSDSDKVENTATESKTIDINYTFSGQERALSTTTLDKSNSIGWNDMTTWLNYAENLTGDFTVKVSILNYGAVSYTSDTANGGDVCWRTALPIVYNPKTKDRWVTRFDWFGWQDDVNGDGTQLGSDPDYNNSRSYVFDYNTDIYPIYKEMKIDMVYKRRGDFLTLDCVIYPQRSPYLGQSYKYHCSLSSIQSDTLSLAFSAEDSKVIVESLQYQFFLSQLFSFSYKQK